MRIHNESDVDRRFFLQQSAGLLAAASTGDLASITNPTHKNLATSSVPTWDIDGFVKDFNLFLAKYLHAPVSVLIQLVERCSSLDSNSKDGYQIHGLTYIFAERKLIPAEQVFWFQMNPTLRAVAIQSRHVREELAKEKVECERTEKHRILANIIGAVIAHKQNNYLTKE